MEQRRTGIGHRADAVSEQVDAPIVERAYRRHFPVELNPHRSRVGDDINGERETADFLERFNKLLHRLR